ncbi:MAG: ABC transporter permease [Nocardioides sp.]|nr:ABC transporter permease [Nocardioides sp.]
MRSFLLLFRNQALGFIREPAAAVFNLLVPFVIVVIQALALGTQQIGNDLPGYRVVDALPVNAGVMFGIIVGLFGMGVGLASMIESRALAGFSLRPGGVKMILLAYGLVLLVMVLLGWIFSCLALWLGWDIRAPDHAAVAVLVLLLGVCVFLALGACIAAVTGSPRGAQGVCSAVFFPLLFLSGAVFPVDTFPSALERVSSWLPGYRFSELLAPTWVEGQSFDWVSLAYLVVMLVVASFLAQRLLFRREDV